MQLVNFQKKLKAQLKNRTCHGWIRRNGVISGPDIMHDKKRQTYSIQCPQLQPIQPGLAQFVCGESAYIVSTQSRWIAHWDGLASKPSG